MPLSFGSVLKQARKVKNLDLSTIAQSINVQEKYLHALEEERVQDIPSITYGKHFLRRYAAYIGLEYTKLEESFTKAFYYLKQREAVTCPQKQKRKEFSLFSHKLLVRRIGIVAVIALLGIGYLGFSVVYSLQPPQLTLTSPKQNLIVHATALEVSGVSDPEASITVNDQAVTTDEKGNFFLQLAVQPGTQIIRVRAEKKHGLATEEDRQVLVLEDKLTLK